MPEPHALCSSGIPHCGFSIHTRTQGGWFIQFCIVCFMYIRYPGIDQNYCKEGTGIQSVAHSASSGAVSGTSSTWIPPRLGYELSANGSRQPPSVSGVDSHSRMRWRRGSGGGWSTYAVRAWNTWLLVRNCGTVSLYYLACPYYRPVYPRPPGSCGGQVGDRYSQAPQEPPFARLTAGGSGLCRKTS